MVGGRGYLKTPASAGMHQLQRPALPALLQCFEHVFELVGGKRRFAQGAQAAFGQRLGLGEQRGFDQAFGGKGWRHGRSDVCRAGLAKRRE